MQRYHHDDESCGRGRGGHHHGGFTGRGFRPPFGPHMQGYGGFGAPGGQRARRGDIRTAVLRLLSEQPMHGYQIIQELSARSGGAWSPSAGSVYPTLQLLADEGLVTAEETAGKKVFSLTETGVAAAADVAEQSAPWDEAAQSDSGVPGYHEATGRLMQAVWQIGRTGSTDQVERAVKVLTEARKQLYAILAED
jgi:DNA-binding PadR family transcriptional regulator